MKGYYIEGLLLNFRPFQFVVFTRSIEVSDFEMSFWYLQVSHETNKTI